jgi:mitochondrial fission protein ELM1
MNETQQSAQHEPEANTAPMERVWVLDDPRAGTSAQAIGIAERMGVGFRRIPLAWSWMAHLAGLAPRGSLVGLSPGARRSVGQAASGVSLPGARGPELVISAGRRSAAVALWLKAQYGCKIVHCMSPGLAGLLRADAFDLLVVPKHDRPPPAANVMQILGATHRLSPLALRQAASDWEERLEHMPHPRVALLVGGPVRGMELPPTMAHGLARKVGRLASLRGGSVLATTSRRTGREASDAVASGLSRVLHLLYRWGEPGENPYRGLIATADVIVVTADSVSMISEACASGAAVYVAMPELAGPRHRRLLDSLYAAGQARPLGEDISVWPRKRLDEAGRVAAEILKRFPLD